MYLSRAHLKREEKGAGGRGKGMGGRARSTASLTPSRWRCQRHLRRGSNYTNYIVRHRGIKHWLNVSSTGVVAVLTPALTHSKDLLPESTILVFAHTKDLLPEGTILVSARTRDILPECTTPQSLLAAKTSLPGALSLLEAKLVLQSRSRNLMYAAIWFVRSTTHKTKTKNRKSVRIRLGVELAFFFACPWTRISRVKMDLTEWRVSSAKMSMANCYRCASVNSVSSYKHPTLLKELAYGYQEYCTELVMGGKRKRVVIYNTLRRKGGACMCAIITSFRQCPGQNNVPASNK